jgi:hypothetical protein
MARKSKQDVAKAKAAKQKKIAIAGSVVLVLLLAVEVPKTMKMMSAHPAAPVVDTTAASTTPTSTDPSATPATPSDPNSLAAPTLAGAAPTTTTTDTTSSSLVSAVPMEVDPGQLKTFEKLASRDPFAAQVPVGASSPSSSGPSTGGGSKGGGTSTTPTPSPTPPGPTKPAKVPTPPSAPQPAPTTAVISLNGELSSVTVGSDFPTSGTVFAKAGSVFHLLSLTQTTAKISIAGGSYADGAAAITLHVKMPVTLQNTADGSKYTLVLEPQGTTVTATGTSGGTGTTPTGSAVPSGSGG